LADPIVFRLAKFATAPLIKKLTPEQKKEKVESFIQTNLFLKDARRLKYLRREDVASRIDNYESELARRIFLDRIILDSIITEQMIADEFNKMRYELRALHILISTQNTKDKKGLSRDEAYKRALQIYARAIGGKESFEALADKYSDDKNSGAGGDLGYFGWGKMVAPFQEAAFNLKIGEISEPVLTNFGYHIIKVIDKRPAKMASFNETKDRIKQNMIRAHMDELRSTYLKYLEDLRFKYEYTPKPENISRLCGLYNQMQDTLRKQAKPHDPLSVFESISENIILATYTNVTVDKKTFLSELSRQPKRIPPDISNPEVLSMILQSVTEQQLLLLEARNYGINKDREYDSQLKSFTNDVLLGVYRNEMITQKVKPDDHELQKYYQSNQSRYLEPASAEVQEIYLADQSKAEKVLEMALSGENFDSLASRYTERYRNKPRFGYLGLINHSKYGDIGKTAVTLDSGVVHGALIPSGKGFAIIRILSRKSETIKPFDRNRVLSDYSRVEQKRVEEKLTLRLKRKYHVKIYWDTINVTE